MYDSQKPERIDLGLAVLRAVAQPEMKAIVKLRRELKKQQVTPINLTFSCGSRDTLQPSAPVLSNRLCSWHHRFPQT